MYRLPVQSSASAWPTVPSARRIWRGTAAAKAKGVYKGRAATIDPAEIRRLHTEEKLGLSATARRLGVARSSMYRVLPPESAVVADGTDGQLRS